MTERIVVMGGGVAGMSAAHELVERGFEVIVLERCHIAGGKARSIPVADEGTASAGHELVDHSVASIKHNLPGEHGFRFFPGFYRHVIDTMRRIPSLDGKCVADHLVPTTRVTITQYGKPSFTIPAMFPRAPGDIGVVLRDFLLLYGPDTGLTPDDLAFFAARIWQILTSCSARRLGEYEGTSWWDFIGAESRSASYQKFLAAGITRSLVAAKARKASTRTIGDVFVQLMLTIANPLVGSTDRVLDGPTDLVWIHPWRVWLESRGVQYRYGAEVRKILMDGGRVQGVEVAENGKSSVVAADHFICAIPLERAAPMINESMLTVDASLGNLKKLAPNVEWMNGALFFLRRDVPMTHGHVIHIDTPWALTSISQLQFWRTLTPADFGDSDVRCVLSVDISDWTMPGGNGREAMRCSREEVMAETWAQLKKSVNVEREILRDEDLHSWFLDADIDADPARPGCLSNAEPLLVNLVRTWALRPEATTAIPNFFLASDYVRTHTDLATMEGANEAARRAVNGLLDRIGSRAPRCELWPLHEPEILAPLRTMDAARYAAGLPWDSTLLTLAANALHGAEPLWAQLRPLMAAVEPFVCALADALEGDPARTEPGTLGGNIDPAGMGAVTGVNRLNALSGRGVPGTGEVAGPAGFVERLSWYRESLADDLLTGIPGVEPQKHLYAPVRDYMARAGKGLRPALCIATARALGGKAGPARRIGAGIEMLHNAFLVHDDIEDGSDMRRGDPTLHRKVGVPLAINAGDAMNALAMRLIRQGAESLGPSVALRMMDEVDHMVMETLEGQAIELGWVRDNEFSIGVDAVLRMLLKKTAWYSFIHPMRLGALVADGERDDLDRYNRFGMLLGLAFQITDDVLNLDGEFQRYGKEIGGDLWEGKRTLILMHAYEHAPAQDRAWIRNYLGLPREQRLPREVHRLQDMLRGGGSIEWAKRAAEAFSTAALDDFEHRAFSGVSPGPDLDWIRSSVAYLTRRQH